MTARDLRWRGFAKNRNIPGYWGYCATCGEYRLMDWWSAPRIKGRTGGEVVVCAKGHVDKRDEAFVRGYQKKIERVA